MKELTQDALKELLHYDQGTGMFTWKVSRGGTAWAGTVAGSFDKVRGYWKIIVGNRNYQTHRLAWFYVYGRWPACLDHINRIRTDNRLANLREVTRSQNLQNTTTHRSKVSGFRGVSFCKQTGRWKAQIGLNGKNTNLGRFGAPEDAHAAYLAAAAVMHTHNPLVLDSRCVVSMGQIQRKTRAD